MKKLLVGVLIGLVLGLWVGVNLGKNKPMFSNPFEEKGIGEMIGDKSNEILKKSGQALEESGDVIKEKLRPRDE